MNFTLQEVAGLVDLSAVHAEHTCSDVEALAALAVQYRCACAYSLPGFTPLLRDLLAGDPTVRLGGTVGFPGGGHTTAVKVAEAQELVRMGCRELDMVINLGWLRSGYHQRVLDDIRAVVEAASGLVVKVILECHYLSDEAICQGSELSARAGAAFVKTGTGWAPTGATLENIALIKSCVGDAIQIKAAGGVRGLETLKEMYRRGARRFGVGMASAERLFASCAREPGS
jgi:deoxyribose-phosphate aldolase